MLTLAVIWTVIAAAIVTAYVLVTTVRGWARDLPEIPDLAAWRANAPQTSLILAADGSHLAELPFEDGRAVGHRTLVALEDLPPHVVEAVLAAEDARFWQHQGVDYRAIVRAAWANYNAGRVIEGASTITQQVARNLLPEEIGMEQSLRRKLREALLARQIERHWTKREVLETYLSFVFLGENAYGVHAAARIYFDREPHQLTLAQAALLAGLIQAPARLDPYDAPEAAKARRDEILARMVRAGFIDEPTRMAAAAEPLALQRPVPSYGTRVPYYTEQVRALLADAIPEDLARGGLTVETAALPALGTQVQADAVTQANAWGESQVAALVWDHQTGYVEALVGGRGWSKQDQFDRLLGSCRQPGSAWKPIVYGAALDNGVINPGTALRDAPITEYDVRTNVFWKPKSGKSFRGLVLAQDAFASSLNAPAIDVLARVGAPTAISFARKLGITSKVTDLSPMALGASCVKPIELARAYAIVARRGWSVAPRFAVRIRRGDEVLFDASVPEDPWLHADQRLDRIAETAGLDPDQRVGASGGQVLDERVAFQLQDMMAAVVQRGTATAARGIGRPAAGKTGTTNDNTDAWFIGFTGRVLAVAWLGFDNPVTKLGREGDGAHAALPLWMRAVRAAEGTRPDVAVPGPAPAGLERVSIDRETGLLAAPGAPGLPVWVKTGTGPTEVSGQPGTSPTDFGRSAREF